MFFRKFLISIILILLIISALFSNSTFAVQAENKGSTFFFYFYGDGCPFCDQVEKNFFPELKERNPDLEIKKIEVWHSPENAKFFQEIATENFGLDFIELGVPAMFIGEYYIIGLPSQRDEEVIEQVVRRYLAGDFISPEDVIPANAQAIRRVGYVDLPILGEINVRDYSFFIITILIAGADGFNPCALWILLFLILLVLKEPSRKRLVLIVGTFILVSGIFYFFILSAWLKLFLFIGHIRKIQIIIALIALIVGFLQVRNFFINKAPVCQISTKKGKIHNFITERAKIIIAQKSLPLTIIGVIILAVMVNFFEFVCSAGFPAIWSSLLALQNFPLIYNYLFILLYVIVFMIDELIIFTIVFFTLKITKVGDKIGKWTGIIGGLLMIILGLIILFKPELLVFV